MIFPWARHSHCNLSPYSRQSISFGTRYIPLGTHGFAAEFFWPYPICLGILVVFFAATPSFCPLEFSRQQGGVLLSVRMRFCPCIVQGFLLVIRPSLRQRGSNCFPSRSLLFPSSFRLTRWTSRFFLCWMFPTFFLPHTYNMNIIKYFTTPIVEHIILQAILQLWPYVSPFTTPTHYVHILI